MGQLHPYHQYEVSHDNKDTIHIQRSTSDYFKCTPGIKSGRAAKRPPEASKTFLLRAVANVPSSIQCLIGSATTQKQD